MPTLPRGKTVEFTMVSNWGDKKYVGLEGIEVFNEQGKLVSRSGRAQKLEHQCIFSQSHWLDTLEPRQRVGLELGQESSIAMIRVWNYRKSRTYLERSVRRLQVQVDGVIVRQCPIAMQGIPRGHPQEQRGPGGVPHVHRRPQDPETHRDPRLGVQAVAELMYSHLH